MPTITTGCTEAAYLSERDWRLGRLVRFVGDLTYECDASAFQGICETVVEQMMSIRVAARIDARLAEACGGVVTPQAIMGLTREELRACGMSWRKADTLLSLADTVTEESLRALADEEDERVRAFLTALPGIGTWTADMFLIFHLDRPDVLPVGDGAFRQAFCWLYDTAHYVEALEVVTPLWRPRSSLAVRYLYRAVNLGLVRRGPSREVLGW